MSPLILKKLLVAFDGSPAAAKALELAALIAENRPMLVTILTVIEGSSDDDLDEGPAAQRREDAQRMMDEAVRKFDGLGCHLESEVRAGVVAETILDLAREGNYDLIVMGDKGQASLVSLFLGSTAYQVSRRAPCSVVLAK